MKFEENPFRVLQVSIYAAKATIIEQADDLSFADTDREDVINLARDILLNPKKRIAAEMRWFIGCSSAKELKYVADCLSEAAPVDDDDYEDYSALAELNFQIYKLDGKSSDLDGCIAYMDELYAELDAEEIREQINAARAKSKFPAVKDTVAIKSELKDIRYEIRGTVQDILKAMEHGKRVKLATELVEYFNEYADDIGVVAEDFFDSYKMEMNPFFDETSRKIISSLTTNKINPSLLKSRIIIFVDARKPLDEFSIALGMNNFDESKKIFEAVRDAAIELFNEKDLIDEPLTISRMLEENFSYLPALAEVIRKDIKLLTDAKENRPTQSFLDAKAALDKIQSSMDQYLHLKEGFKQANLDFCEKVFKPNCEVIIEGLMLLDRNSRKPAEWTALNLKVATIYLHMGTAMTWTRRADLAFEYFQKALPYAEASGDAELISLARKRVDEWRKINQQIAANSKDDSSGCIWWIIIIGFILWLAS